MHFSFSGDRGNYPQPRVSAIKRSPSQESIIPQRRHTAQQFAGRQFAAQQFAAQQFAGRQLAGRQFAAQQRAGQQLAAQQIAEQQRAGQQLAAQQLAEQQRAGQHRVAQQRAAQQLAEQQRVAQQRAAQQLAEQQREAQQRAAQQLAEQQREAQQLAAQQLAAQQLAAQQLAAQQLAEQQLAAQQLAAQQQQQKNERLIEQQRKVEEENKMVESYNKHYDTFVPSSLKSYHRLKCFSNLDLIRNIIIDDFGDSSKKKETILIEFRPFVHIEYLLRNTILKLSNWDHTVVCGNKNYNMISEMCNKICDGSTSSIKIIRLDIDNLVPSEYSKLLLTKDFWDKFDGEKLLVYQEDSMLFHSDIEPFLKYDYVGAPWPENQDDNALGVGNGGFSLRTKSKLLECIEKVKPEDLQLGSSTSDYMKNTKSYIVPEDVYFSKSMIDHKIGKVAPRDVAIEFSQETQLSKNPLGGHNYWLAKNIFDINRFHTIGVYSPYEYSIGGGEKYLSHIIKFFLKCGCTSVDFYNNTKRKIIDRTFEEFFSQEDIKKINIIGNNNINPVTKYDFFIEMGNGRNPTRLKKASATKKIYHCQFPFDYYRNKICDDLHYVDHIILNSEYTEKHYKYALQDNDKEKIIVNYPPSFRPDIVNDIKKQKNTFVMIGRIHAPNKDAHNKCHIEVIQIFLELLKLGIPFKLYVIGTVQDESYYKYLSQFNRTNRIEMTGNCPENIKEKIINSCQYHIHATGLDTDKCFGYEHFGISTVECINRGCLPICINGGYFPYYIKNGKNGLLFDDVVGLTNILMQILTSEQPIIDLEKANKINQTIISKFSEKNFFHKLAKSLI
jgi:glycosyltransferase involved in cell wall biosynthesis